MSATAGLPYDDIEPYDVAKLDTLMAKTKGRLFFKKGAGFLGSLLCDMSMVWDDTCATAWCDSVTIGWNPKFFTWLTLEERVTVLAHELWHAGYDHCTPTRFVGMCPDYVNQAADFVINNRLEDDGFTFGPKLQSLQLCLDHKYDNMSTEEVYHTFNIPPGSNGSGNPSPQGQGVSGPLGNDAKPSPLTPEQTIGNLVKAAQASRMAKEAGVVPGEIEEIIDKFLNPILPWERLLARYFTDISKDDYSWKRPSRRYEEDYLPSLDGENALEHLAYYMDVSGSVQSGDVLRFNSEVSYIHKQFQPKRLSLITFDTIIQDRYEFTDDMPFDEITIHGRGGTSLAHVYEDIKKTRPTAAIIFSDLFCPKMKANPGVPVLWIVVGNKKAQVPFGKMIHIDNE